MSTTDDLAYVPQRIQTQSLENVVEQLQRELYRISSAMDVIRVGYYPRLYVAPDKPRDGMVRYADGIQWDPGGGEGIYTYYNERWNSMGSTDFLIEVNKGNIAGHSMVHKFSHNDDVDTAEEDIWHTDGVYPPLTTGVQLEFSSSSANDDIAGSHARKLTMELILDDFTEVIETHDIDGTTTTTATNVIRCNRAYVDEVGTYGETNDGNITIRVIGAGAIQATISAGTGQTHKSHYTIPAGKTGYVLRVSLGVDSTKSCTFYMVKRENPNGLAAPYKARREMHEWIGVMGEFEETFKADHALPEKTDIWFSAKAAANNTAVHADYDILLVDN